MGRQAHIIATSISMVLCSKGVRLSELKMRRGRMGDGWLPYGVYLVFGIEVVGEIRVEVESMDDEYKT